jgi:hypothetical protein
VLLVFVLLAYLIWLKLFSIYRYLVPLELLAPLLIWLLCHADAGGPGPALGWLGAGCVRAVHTTVCHLGAWRLDGTGFPRRSAATGAAAGQCGLHGAHADGMADPLLPAGSRLHGHRQRLPESPAYLQRLQAQAAARTGQHYVMLPAAVNIRQSGAERKLALARALGLTASAADRARLDGWLRKVRFQVEVQALAAEDVAASGQACTLVLQPQYRLDLAAEDAALQAEVLGIWPIMG